MTEPARPSSTPQTSADAVVNDPQWATARGEKWRAHLHGMEATLAPVDEPLIAALRLDAPLRIAEIGCGGGGTALSILARAPVGSAVHGFDISPALIELARQRTASQGSAVRFELADMATARVPDAPYDRLVSRFGIMFFDDPPVAFGNLAQWLAPGGQLAFAAWGRASDNPWVALTREVVAEVVEVPATDPQAPGQFRYAEVSRLVSLLDEAGFSRLEARNWRGALPVGGGLPAAEAAQFALAAFSSFGELLAEAGPDALTRAHRALTARFSEHQRDGVVLLDASVHIVTGTRS